MAAAATVAVTMAAPGAAWAAPRDPFDPATPTVFVAQGNPTQLSILVQSAGGATFEAEGGPAPFRYNAIAYNTADNYLYGIRFAGPEGNHLVRIGQEGEATDLGEDVGLPIPPLHDGYNQATFGEGAYADTLFVRNSVELGVIDLVDVAAQTSTRLTLPADIPNLSDIVFKDGYLWGVYSTIDATDATIYRIDPATGAAETFPSGLGLPGADFGARWIYGNGNLGISANQTGQV
ncbi:MAG TPA: hypothetical protein VNQ73_21400 [Ilumatobacter sp.]|nr:hypothetical protein [Ilumatobacter sp.]